MKLSQMHYKKDEMVSPLSIQEHQHNRDERAQRGEDYHASSNNYDRRQHLPGSIQSF
jgi:hypothetical protein